MKRIIDLETDPNDKYFTDDNICLCGECLEGIIEDITCDVCNAVECSYYELSEYEYEEIENLDHNSRINYLREYTFNTFVR